MRIARYVLIVLVVLAVAQPMFACTYCDFTGNCEWTQESTPRCKLTRDGCTNGLMCIGSAGISAIAAEYQIASVEVKHEGKPAVAKKAAQPVVAEARIAAHK
ncbi:MAG TPA: hypothetical protein VF618_05030 [Thermoanaerobaculia bacterium]